MQHGKYKASQLKKLKLAVKYATDVLKIMKLILLIFNTDW